MGYYLGLLHLGLSHGIEPSHGWPIAAAYALKQPNKWLYGFAASFILGLGHLISSIAMVGVFFYAKSYFNLTQVNEPITILGRIQIGGPVSLVAGVLLIVLGVREYYEGYSYADENHDQSYEDHEEHSETGLWARIKAVLPFVRDDSHSHGHSHGEHDDAANRGLLGIAWFAFVIGFAHEEEFEIIALCAGSEYCLELMGIYALAVIFAIVGLTLLLAAGYEHYEEKVEQYTLYLPAFSAVVLIVMGVGFITGLF